MRKLQYIDDQYLLNVPKRLAAKMGWHKGDYIEVAQKDRETIEIRRIATNNATRDEAMVPTAEEETRRTFAALFSHAEEMNPVDFTWQLADFSRAMGKLRKYRMRAQAPILNPPQANSGKQPQN